MFKIYILYDDRDNPTEENLIKGVTCRPIKLGLHSNICENTSFRYRQIHYYVHKHIISIGGDELYFLCQLINIYKSKKSRA